MPQFYFSHELIKSMFAFFKIMEQEFVQEKGFEKKELERKILQKKQG